MLQSRGLDPAQAGTLAGLSIIVQAPVAMVVSTWAGRVTDHRLAIAAASLLCPLGVVGCMTVPDTGLVATIVMLGMIQGSLLALGLTTIGMRSRNAVVAAQLSGMSQGIGYAIAALGPAAAGLLHARSGGWREVLWLYVGIGAASALCGIGAGQPRMIGARPREEMA
jgi:CP family cyanate transporter-like MFS transporter